MPCVGFALVVSPTVEAPSAVFLMHAPRSWICLPLWVCVPLGWAAPQDNTPSSKVLERDSDPGLANSQDG